MGLLEDQDLWVNEIIPSENEVDTVSCVFPPQRLAQVAHELVEGRIKGKIVGWYHSHPGHGLFLSQTDLDTHMQFYQFSSVRDFSCSRPQVAGIRHMDLRSWGWSRAASVKLYSYYLTF